MQEFLDSNRERFIVDFEIDRENPTFAERILKELKDKNEGLSL
jgi:hypothetical protein